MTQQEHIMIRLVSGTLLISFALASSPPTQATEEEHTIGHSSDKKPLRIISKGGRLLLSLAQDLYKPIAVVSTSINIARAVHLFNQNETYVVIIDRSKDQKHIFRLDRFKEKLRISTRYASVIEIENKGTYSVVRVDTEKLVGLEHSAPKGKKPSFPDWIPVLPCCKWWWAIVKEWNWKIDSFGGLLRWILMAGVTAIGFWILGMVDLIIMFYAALGAVIVYLFKLVMYWWF